MIRHALGGLQCLLTHIILTNNTGDETRIVDYCGQVHPIDSAAITETTKLNRE